MTRYCDVTFFNSTVKKLHDVTRHLTMINDVCDRYKTSRSLETSHLCFLKLCFKKGSENFEKTFWVILRFHHL